MKKHDLYIIAAGSLWALTGPVFQLLASAGFTRMGAVGVRLFVAFCATLLLCFVKKIPFWQMSPKHLLYCAGAGIPGYAMFNFAYFNTIASSSLSIAASLLYTSPAFVVLLSLLFYKEKVTKQKLAALFCTVFGSILITGTASQTGQITGQGLLWGLASGFGYALYNLLSKAPLSKNQPEAVALYSLFFGMLAAFVIEPPSRYFYLLKSPLALIPALVLGLLCCMLPSLLFAKGLAFCKPSRASILVSFELIVAAIIGFAQGDSVSPIQIMGLFLLVFAIVALNLPVHQPPLAKS